MSDKVEEAVGELCTALVRLRQEGKLQEEYDAMGAIISMLSEDRQHMRSKFAGKIEI
jgi:hypothetical protein